MIGNNERIDDLQVAVREAVQGSLPSIWTSMPGIIQSYDAASQTCEVQPAIKSQVTAQDGTKSWVQLPLCVDVPVQFASGGGWTQTFPIAKGDEGIIMFSCRCIDSWWQSGGVQTQAELRLHDLSDGIFVPGIRSQAKKLQNVASDQCELRNDAGTLKLSTTATGFKMIGTFELDGNLMLNGQILAPEGATYAGNIATTGTVSQGVGTADSVTLGGHVHTGNNIPPKPGT